MLGCRCQTPMLEELEARVLRELGQPVNGEVGYVCNERPNVVARERHGGGRVMDSLLAVVPAEQVKNDGVPHALAAVPREKRQNYRYTYVRPFSHTRCTYATYNMYARGSRCDAGWAEGTMGTGRSRQ